MEELEYEELPKYTPLPISMAAGAIAGIMEHTIMYPVDAIKTRMQVAGSGNLYRGVISSISAVSAAEGASALWRGMLSMIVGAGPAHALHFAVYEATISMLAKDGHAGYHPAVSATAGLLADVTSNAIMNPFDVIKQHMQVNGGSNSLIRTASQIARTEGFGAFYVSYPTTLLMSVPFSVVNFTVYDTVSQFCNPQRRHDPLIHCLAGGASGAAAAAVSTPFDVIKTLLQTRGVTEVEEARQLKGIRDTASYIWRTRGWQGFFRGVRPRIVANMPSTAICWTVYEMAKYYISLSGIAN